MDNIITSMLSIIKRIQYRIDEHFHPIRVLYSDLTRQGDFPAALIRQGDFPTALIRSMALRHGAAPSDASALTLSVKPSISVQHTRQTSIYASQVPVQISACNVAT